MKPVTITNAMGVATHTGRVNACDIETHLLANDLLSSEAAILKAYVNSDQCEYRDPLAWKFADPTEGARFVFDASDLQEIANIDPSLLVPVEITWLD